MITLNEIIAAHGLDKLNSASKYPSILTLHATGDKGTLKPELNAGAGFGDLPVILTEKVDGTNTRIIFDETGDFIVGSREDLLYARGDRIWPPKDPILKELLGRNLATVVDSLPKRGITVIFGEVYGERINTGYTGSNGFLLFDLAYLDTAVLELPVQEISLWRENGGQAFQPAECLKNFAALAPMVPSLHVGRESVEASPAYP